MTCCEKQDCLRKDFHTAGAVNGAVNGCLQWHFPSKIQYPLKITLGWMLMAVEQVFIITNNILLGIKIYQLPWQPLRLSGWNQSVDTAGTAYLATDGPWHEIQGNLFLQVNAPKGMLLGSNQHSKAIVASQTMCSQQENKWQIMTVPSFCFRNGFNVMSSTDISSALL